MNTTLLRAISHYVPCPKSHITPNVYMATLFGCFGAKEEELGGPNVFSQNHPPPLDFHVPTIFFNMKKREKYYMYTKAS